VLFGNSLEETQEITNAFGAVYQETGMEVNTGETKFLCLNTLHALGTRSNSIKVHGLKIEEIDERCQNKICNKSRTLQ